MSRTIYLDYQATTPLDPRVAEEMQPYLLGRFGNPHSEHSYGWEAAEAIDRAAGDLADLIGCLPGEIVFTSGATEANNLAIQGVARSRARRGNHVVTTAIEHKCVLNTVLALKEWGFETTVVPVGRNGIVSVDAIAEALREDTTLVSVMTANNEVGTLQPIAEVGSVCRQRGIVFHTDAAQAVGKIPLDVEQLEIDMLSLSAHKFHGPKGIGALYVSSSCSVPPEPLIIGGAQQNGLRAGTVPPFLCVGLGAASRIAKAEMDSDRTHCLDLREVLLGSLRERFPGLAVNGDLQERLPGSLNLRFPGIDAPSLLTALAKRIAASTGSACNSGLIEPSYVLLALGLTMEEANSSIRFGFGRFTRADEIESAAEMIAQRAASLGRSLALSNA